jgi:hypothetical protein
VSDVIDGHVDPEKPRPRDSAPFAFAVLHVDECFAKPELFANCLLDRRTAECFVIPWVLPLVVFIKLLLFFLSFEFVPTLNYCSVALVVILVVLARLLLVFLRLMPVEVILVVLLYLVLVSLSLN